MSAVSAVSADSGSMSAATVSAVRNSVAMSRTRRASATRVVDVPSYASMSASASSASWSSLSWDTRVAEAARKTTCSSKPDWKSSTTSSSTTSHPFARMRSTVVAK